MRSPRSSGTTGTTTDRCVTCKLAALVGVVFLAVGILGFIPGITSSYSDMAFAGHTSGAYLLGLFQVSILHNLVHLAYGVAGLAMFRAFSTARTYLVAGGIIYLVLWIYGLLIHNNMTSGANFVPLNNADNWLHLGLGAGMIALGLIGSRADATSTTTATRTA